MANQELLSLYKDLQALKINLLTCRTYLKPLDYEIINRNLTSILKTVERILI